MTSTSYLTTPPPSDTMPPGIPYIVGNEAAERFSFYGMRTILVIYMTKYLFDSAGNPAVMPEAEAKSYYHLFISSAYFFPIIGAILSDWLWGKYRTILWLSIVYCLGHAALAAIPGREGLFLGLILIAMGAGGIKPCVSAHVGDQFGEQNQHLLSRVFGWFYLSINLGALISSLLTPELLESEWMLEHLGEKYTHQVAFGVPGVLMLLATIVFWLGRNRFVHVPPGGAAFFKEMLGQEGLSAMVRLIPLYLFVAVFWSLYDQTGSEWVLQAEEMNRNIVWLNFSDKFPWVWFGQDEVSAAALQAVNPLLILLYVPLFAYVIYPLAGRVVTLTPLRKIGCGMFLIAASFALCGWLQTRLDAGESVSAYWQIAAYMVLTASEVLVSVTCLEFSYTQAPPRMKSLVMALYLLSVSLGNVLASGVNWFIQNPEFAKLLEGARYYWFFSGLMTLAAVLFIPYALTYREKTYLPNDAA